MIHDAMDFDEDTAFTANVCVVGAGPAGIALALKLADSGLSVLLLESGGDRREDETQALCEGEVAAAALHSAPDKYRQRGLGGSSATWGGRCVPFDANDFERRPWIAHSGWPFGLGELMPYYTEANRLCEAGRFAYTATTAFANDTPQIIRRFHGKRFTDTTLERFSCPTNFGQRYRQRLAESHRIRVLLHANVTQLVTDSSGNVDRLIFKTLSGRTHRAFADRFVLATGGMEIPRILLQPTADRPNGVGNEYGWVGRTYMCHIAGTFGEVRLAESRAAEHGYQMSTDGIYCRRRFALTAEAQERLRVGNFVAHLHHPRITDPAHRTGALSALYFAKPFISYEYGKRLSGAEREGVLGRARHVANVVADPFGTAGFLLHWARRRTLAHRKFPSIIVRPRTGVYTVDFNAEQEPNRESRVTLIKDRDALGMRRLRVDWRYTDGDMRTVRHAMTALAEDIAGSGCGTLTFDVAGVEQAALRDGAYGGHHIGTARMAVSPRQGVTDANCRVHGVGNLYIASSAVFPTSSQANPTLTIVAMALRLANHLQQQATSYQLAA